MDPSTSLSPSASDSSSGLSSPLSPAPPGLPTNASPDAASIDAQQAALTSHTPGHGASTSLSATTAFLAHEASLSELLVSAPATLAREGSAPLQQETIETLSGAAKELASLNQFASQRLKANQPLLVNAVHQLRDLKSDLDLAHRRLFKLIQQLKQIDPVAVQLAEDKFPLDLEDD